MVLANKLDSCGVDATNNWEEKNASDGIEQTEILGWRMFFMACLASSPRQSITQQRIWCADGADA